MRDKENMETESKAKPISFFRWKEYTGARRGIAHLTARLFLAFAIAGGAGFVYAIVQAFIDIPDRTLHTLMAITGIISLFAIGGAVGAMAMRGLVKEALEKEGLDIGAEDYRNTTDHLGIPALKVVPRPPNPATNTEPLSEEQIKQLAYDRVEPQYIWYGLILIAIAAVIYSLGPPHDTITVILYDFTFRFAIGIVIVGYIFCGLWERATKREIRVIEKEAINERHGN